MGEGKSLYDRLARDRDPYLMRAREAAELTIPSLMPPYDNLIGGHGQNLIEPYQSMGARGVNNLTSKLLLALLPINAKFFRLAVDEGSLHQLQAFKQAETEVQQSLGEIEDQLLDDIEAKGLRINIYSALQQIVNSGNALLHVPTNQSARVFRLDSYVVERDPRGNLLAICVRQQVSPKTLNEATRRAVGQAGEADSEAGREKSVEVYTIVRLSDDGHTWKEWQEVEGTVIGGVTTHKSNRLPWIPLRMYTTDGEDYGRGHVELYIADLRALNALSKALQEGAAAAAKVVMLVNPDGPTRIRRLAKANNGECIPGRADDVHPLQLNKFNDFATVRQEMDSLKRDLGHVFLLNSTVTRDAERVTAEEIKLMAAELNDVLSGTFSLLSADLQMPLVNILLGNAQDEGRIPPLPDQVRPVIVTGLDAIGRGHDLARLDEFLHGAMQTFGPEVSQYINIGVYLQQRATALGIPTDELIKSDQQLQQEQQQAQTQQAMQDLAPTLIKEFPEGAAEVAQNLIGAGAAVPQPA